MEKKHVEKHAAETKAVFPKGFSVRGATLVGRVVSAKMPKTVTVERSFTRRIAKYERYKKTKSKLHAHNPEEMNAREGDLVRIGETRKISKTKNFVVIEVIERGGSNEGN